MINASRAVKQRVSRAFGTGCCAVVLACVGVMPGLAEGARVAAVFPFELVIEKQMTNGMMPPPVSEVQKKRLALMDAKLQELLTSSGKYSQVDLTSLADKIESASPIHDCNGCGVDLAKEAGAELSVVGVVRQSSSSLINISIFVREVATGDVVNVGAVTIREDNDAGWVRAVRSIVRNRILKRLR